MSADTHFHSLRVVARDAVADDAVSLGLEVPPALAEAYAFEPGQHLTLRTVIAGQECRRSYSLCDRPGQPMLRIGVRRVEGGLFSNWVHERLHVGEVVDVMPPQGRFVLRPGSGGARHVLGVAGGSGITPILAIARALLDDEPHSRFTLVYGNRTARSTMFKEELEDLKNRHLARMMLIAVFSREPVDTPLSGGRIDAPLLHRLATTLIDVPALDAAFVCGPEGMIEVAQQALLDARLPAERIHAERFGVAARRAAPAMPQPGDASDARITITRDGLTQTVPYSAADGSILDACGRAGLELPFSCKSGVCGTCRARVQAGQVRMDRNFALEPAEVAAGFVLTCQSHPVSDSVVLSFDER